MLILSRKCNEQITIGDGIVVTVVSIRGGSVRLGVEAPSTVAVHRREVYQAIQEGKCEADRGKDGASTGDAGPGVAEGTGTDPRTPFL